MAQLLVLFIIGLVLVFPAGITNADNTPLAPTAKVAAKASCGAPRILSYHADRRGANGGERDSPHSGLDFEAEKGAPAVAAAPGRVTYIWGIGLSPADKEDASCGFGVQLMHGPKGKRYFTRYCHLDKISVQMKQEVARGETVGAIGTTGRAAGIPHLHFELCTGGPCYGYFGNTSNPLPHFVGHHDPDETNPSAAPGDGEQKINLTYPVECPYRKAS